MGDDLLDLNHFRMALMREGVSYEVDDIRYLFEVARTCAKTAGVLVGEAVILPVVGAVPGWVAGALA
jgi:hypothetical protein